MAAFPQARAQVRAKLGTELFYLDLNTVAHTNGDVRSPEAYYRRTFDFIDNVPNTIGTIAWDAGLFDSATLSPVGDLPLVTRPPYDTFPLESAPIFDTLVKMSRERGLRALLACRVGAGEQGLGNEPYKDAHPEDYILDWDRMPNLEREEIRNRKLAHYREAIGKYGFEGLIIDFCRHTPFLTPGKQWEKRGCVTKFLRGCREVLDELEAARGCPLLLGARIPETTEKCRTDGLDLEAWAKEGLVDLLVLGTRSYDVDLPAFRTIFGRDVKLFPNHDAHHTTDGYYDPDPAVLRGVYHTWWSRGADGVSLFNWLTARMRVYEETAGDRFLKNTVTIQENDELLLPEAGDRETLAQKDRTYVAERRGGYPWQNGGANHNLEKPLPLILPNDGSARELRLRVSRAPGWDAGAAIRLVVYGLVPPDRFRAALNGTELTLRAAENVTDRQIFPLRPAPISGFGSQSAFPENHAVFTEFTSELPLALVKDGENELRFRVERVKYPHCSTVELERAEITLRAGKENPEGETP